MPSSNRFIRGLQRIGAVLGVQYPEDTPKQADQDIQLTLHTPTEMRYLPGIYSPDDHHIDTLPSAGALLNNLIGISQQAGNWSRTAQSLNILAPEIRDASEIYISSIISPTDLQTQAIQVLLDGTDLGQELENKISTMLTDFFNNDFEIAAKLKSWLHTAMFADGAAPVLIIPQSNIVLLNQAVDIDETKMGHDVKQIIKNANHPGPLNPSTVPEGTVTSGENYWDMIPPLQYDKTNPSLELLLPSDYTTTRNTRKHRHYEQLVAEIDQAINAGFETLSAQPGWETFKSRSMITDSQAARQAIRELFSDSTNSSIVMTSNISLLNRNREEQESTQAAEKRVAEYLLLDPSHPLYLLDVDNKLEHQHHPAVVALPYQAVIPVILPGTPDKQLGYYILVDQWGTPLTDHIYDRSTINGPRKLTEGAMQAVFGQPAAYQFAAGLNDEQRFESTLMMFGLTLRYLLRDKLDRDGFRNATVEDHEATTLCLFRHLLARKRVGIIFVPASMLTYFAFDYHADGTGKSKIEDLSTLLSLRTVLIISGVMAATENAIDHKVLEIDVDEKNANVTQYLNMVRDAFIEKKMLRFDNEPLTVQRDLIQRSLTLLPKNMRGIKESLNINTDHKSNSVVMPEQGFMDQLTNWLITGLDVPHAAMNQTGETEYSRSVATTNIMFNNKIKGAQKVVIKFGNKFIRNYVKYSSPLQEKILEVLREAKASLYDSDRSSEAITDDVPTFDAQTPAPARTPNLAAASATPSTSTPDTDKTKPSTPSQPDELTPGETELQPGHKSKQQVEMNDRRLSERLATIVQNIRITLPAPQIVVDKAQYEEISAYIDAVDKVVNVIFSENQIMDNDAKDMFALFRETVKSDMVRDYIKQIGFQSSFNIPFPKDIDLKNTKDLYHYISNQKLGFDNFKKYIVDQARQHLENANNDSGGYEDNGGQEDEYSEPDNFETAENSESSSGERTEAEPQEPQEETREGENQNPESIDFDNTPPPPSF